MLEDALREQGLDILKVEDLGFVAYKCQQSADKQDYFSIENFYLCPDKRSVTPATKLLESLVVVAKEKAVTFLVWGVANANPQKESQLLQILLLGFKVKETDKQGILFIKQV